MNPVVYRHFSSDGELLYVGCTQNIINRTTQHMSGSRWMSKVTTITISHYSNFEAALKAERAAIKRESPKFNLSGTPRNRAVMSEKIKKYKHDLIYKIRSIIEIYECDFLYISSQIHWDEDSLVRHYNNTECIGSRFNMETCLKALENYHKRQLKKVKP